ncbi:MAG: type III polyketide synthase, partial [Halobacteriales archaeon]|nr:type III polyketide synthase [Halobacteriales archaeon]
GFKDRTQAFLAAGLPMAEEAARGAVANAGLRPADLDGVVYVCTTGLATPSLDARLANRLGLRSNITRLPVWGLGCGGGVAGLARAADLASVRPEGNVLVVALELCSLAFDVQRAVGVTGGGPDKKALVAASLFSDGCAAVVVSGDGAARSGSLRFTGAASHLFPATERVMGWDVEDHNLDVVLSPEIPAIVEAQMAGVVQPFLDRHLGAGGRPDHWILHPGGAKVVDAYRTALGLGDGALEHTEAALSRHGNMSSPTVLFALADATSKGRPKPGESALLAALGPGFASELALLEGS